MNIIKKINTSAALAVDSKGREVIVFGKGIGFPKVPYELTDLSCIERTFYDVAPNYIALISELPEEILMASAEIVEEAEVELGCTLNPNLPFTLADHLNFAIERLKNGIDLLNPIAYDVRNLYPKEARIGDYALEVLEKTTNVKLSESEAVSVALHLINAEANVGDLQSAMRMIKIADEVVKIVERQLDVVLDKESYNYSRFNLHLRYLIQRLSTSVEVEERGVDLLRSLAKEHPDVYTCALKISHYFEGTWKWKCNEEEILYLMLHIFRLLERVE